MTGHPSATRRIANVLQWADESYKGLFSDVTSPPPPGDFGQFDFAVLQIYEYEDAKVLAGQDGQFMRLSTRGFASSGATLWGFGFTDDVFPLNGRNLSGKTRASVVRSPSESARDPRNTRRILFDPPRHP